MDYQDKAQAEMDDAKYAALAAEFEKSLKGCIEPFEKAFEITKDNQIKTSIAEYLKNACYRFIDDGQEYADKYKKYTDVVNGAQAE